MSNRRTGLERQAMGTSLEKPRHQWQTIRRLWGYMQKERVAVVIAIITVVLFTLLQLVAPWLIGVIIDEYILPRNVAGAVDMTLLLASTYAAVFIITYIQTITMIFVAQKTIRRLRQQLFEKLQRLPIRFFDRQQQGDLMSRVTNDIDSLNMALTQSITQIVSSVLMVVGVAVAMFWMEWRLALVALTIIPLIVYVTKYIIKRSSVNYKARQRHLGQLNGYVEETISGTEIITLFGQEQHVNETFHEKNEKLRQSALHAETVSGMMGPFNNAMNGIGVTLVIGAGAYFILRGYMTIGVLAAFVTYTRQFFRPINQLSNLLNVFQAAIAGAERVFDVLDEKDEPADMQGAIAATEFAGHVVFENVSFSYEQNQPILRNISFEAKQGEMIALVGPTGSGKTTVMNVLTRFYDVDDGQIYIDGRPITHYTLQSLREHVGIVLQDTYLFKGTIRENIRFAKLDATDAEVEEAAKVAYAHQFIRHLPEQYDTLVTSGGTNLSQGQRQLLAIARAILENPHILILDEATSNVDTRTEVHIQQGLLNLMAGRTSFVIAHRLQTIEQADRILVLQQGVITEHGSHEELIAKRGFYYDMQTKRQMVNG